VLENLLADGVSEPPWIAIDDGTGSWLLEVAARPPAERHRGVLAVMEDDSLVAALRLGLGGAFSIPPSSLGVREALETAAASPMIEAACDPDLALQVAAGADAATVITYRHRGFRQSQLGNRVLTALLRELATALDEPPALLPWPALLVVGRKQRAAATAWKKLHADGHLPSHGLELWTAAYPVAKRDQLAAIYRALLDGESDADDDVPPPEPVHELPSGRRVGWWGLARGQKPDDGWFATVESSNSRNRWKLLGVEGTSVVEEVLTPAELRGVGEVAAVRIPGWVTRKLGPGTPAGLLVSRLAEAAASRELPLWLTALDGEALHFALRLPGSIWVDGPAVPR
jgi:hypothetical protein